MAAKQKITPGICYVAGLLSKSENDKNAVGVTAQARGVEEKFIGISVSELKVLPQKILFTEERKGRHLYYYHSRIAKQLLNMISHEDKVFKTRNELSANYVAGMFDAAGGFGRGGLYITGLTPADEVMLANLGIHTRGGNIMNISSFLELVGGRSVLVGLNTEKR